MNDDREHPERPEPRPEPLEDKSPPARQPSTRRLFLRQAALLGAAAYVKPAIARAEGAVQLSASPYVSVVQNYISLINGIRFSGEASAIDTLMTLWEPTGVFEFTDTPGFPTLYSGSAAIRSRYEAMLHAGELVLALEGTGGGAAQTQLGPTLNRLVGVTPNANGVNATVATCYSTADGRGFQVQTNTFVFTFNPRSGRLSYVTERVSMDAVDCTLLAGTTRENLSVNDIGRISLAAWAVV